MSQISIALRFMAAEHDFLTESQAQLLKRAAGELERLEGLTAFASEPMTDLQIRAFNLKSQ